MTKQQIASLINQGRAKEAVELCLPLCVQDRSDIVAWKLLGGAQLQLGELGKAEEAGRMAVSLNQDDSGAWTLLVQSLINQGRTSEAVHGMQELLRLNPQSGALHGQLATMLLQLGDVQGALKHYHQEVAIDPQNGIAHHTLGQAYQTLHRFREAESNYREAIRLCPSWAEPHMNLGHALLQMGARKEALSCQKKALSLDSRMGEPHYNIGLCLYDDQNLEPALDAFRKASELAPSNDMAKCLLGILYLQQGNKEGAGALIEVANQSPFTASRVESYQYAAGAAPQARFFSTARQMLKFAIDNAGADGLFLEFGVCYGTSITMIANQVDATVHGFDSFEGLPESWDVSVTRGVKREQAGTYSTLGRPPPVPDNVALHIGLFEDTLPGFVEQHQDHVSFVNVDCDLYSSTRTVFQHLGDRFVPGSVVVFDDYFCYPEWRQHEYKAFQEFVTKFGIRYEYLAFSFFTGQAVVRILEVNGDT